MSSDSGVPVDAGTDVVGPGRDGKVVAASDGFRFSVPVVVVTGGAML